VARLLRLDKRVKGRFGAFLAILEIGRVGRDGAQSESKSECVWDGFGELAADSSMIRHC
jgi:hypothetical protein